jgi:hypothetical protein
MSDPDNFLSRWSRRKLEPQDAPDEKKPPEAKPVEAPEDAVESQAAAPGRQDPKQEPAFDPSTLPSLDSITAGTDIRDFLKPGVPLSLSRAALRRAWTSDPAIRDFIGIAENQWDFTNDSIAGFGPLDPADVPRLFAQFMGSSSKKEPGAGDTDAAQPSSRENAAAASDPEPERAVTAQETAQPPSDAAVTENSSQRSSENDAAQNDGGEKNLDYAAPRHGHGRALPT